jgi:hypothetical protein
MHTLRAWPIAIVGALSLLLLVTAHAGAGEAPTPAPDASRPEAAQQTPAPASAAPARMMECPMMASMSSGMPAGRGMMGMGMSGMSMNHSAGPTATLTDMAQNVSLRDMLRIVQDLTAVQERMLKSLPAARAAEIRPEIDRIKLRSGELLTEINGMVSATAKGE